MRILLTGASGYLGLHITRALLDAGHDVTAFVRSPQRMGELRNHGKLAVVRGDMQDDAGIARATIGHGACVHAALVWGPPGTEFDLLDVRATAVLFDCAGRAGAERLVYISSTAVHRPFEGVMRESDELAAPDIYGATKSAGEASLWTAASRYDLHGVVLRPGPIVGPPAIPGGAFKSDRRIEEMVANARRGEPIIVPHDPDRQFVAAEDVARASAVAVTSPDATGTYLCVDREITTWESIARLATEIARSSSRIDAPEPETISPPPRFDDQRIVELLGGPLDSEETLRRHLEFL